MQLPVIGWICVSHKWSSLKGRSRIHKLSYRSSWHKRGLDASSVKGNTKCGGIFYTVYRAPDSYNTVGHPLNYAIGNELGKLGSSRRVVNDNRWGYSELYAWSSCRPLKFPLNGLKKRSTRNFQKVMINLRTRRFLEKAVPREQLIMNIASPEVIRVEETQMSEVTQSWTGRY